MPWTVAKVGIITFGDISAALLCKHYCQDALSNRLVRTAEILSANLRRLMSEAGNPSSGSAVDRVAKSLGLRLGRTTVTRYAHADGNPTLDHIESLAKVFDVQVWQLLHPTMGRGIEER